MVITAVQNNNETPQAQTEFDVVVMGAGFAGICQARHLMLKIPNIRVALIDPRSQDCIKKDLKIGESTVEIATLFICKELGLYDYTIENHPPKFGLNFHWPKNPEQTQSVDDYFHIWANRQPPLASIQMNRGKFEHDVLEMVKEMGVHYYNGRVIDLDLTSGDRLNTVTVKLANESVVLSAKHVIDASGRRFLIGQKKNNLMFAPEDLYGVNTGSVWLRVNGVDRTKFHSGYDPNAGTCSHYYATNHWFGYGHWLWMIPTEIDSMELSIGVIFHRDQIADNTINNREKFLQFLKANHTLLYDLIETGDVVDFHYRPRVAHMSKTLFSEENWYVVGNAAYIFDAFYSMGTTMISLAIESITEIIQSKLNGAADAEEKRQAFNDFNIAFARNVNHLIVDHGKQLGNASIMSWRIYFEYMFWFGVLIPMYVGKWHLDLKFVKEFVANSKSAINGFNSEVYRQFNLLTDRGKNIGLMDCYRADQLLWGYHTPQHFDSFLEDAKYEPYRCNVFAGMKFTYFFQAIWYTRFRWKAFGLLGILSPKFFYYFFERLALSIKSAIAELVYLFLTRNLSDNSQIEQMREEFKSYQYRPTLGKWTNA